MLINENELQGLIKDPAEHFNDPAAVLYDERLDSSAKRRILESWKVDEEELATATNENMGPEERTFLSQVQQALSTLDNIT